MEKNMKVNFEILKERVKDSLENTDLERINWELSKLEKSTLVSGVGGSQIVSTFTTKVLSKKNNIIAQSVEPRDFLYHNNHPYHNVISCSYSGNNYGVELSFSKKLKNYLLSNQPSDRIDVTNLTYQTTIEKERSFISLGATLIPISVVLNYYLEDKELKIVELIEKNNYNFNSISNIYEIFTGYDTITSSKYLESTLVESGIGIPITHDKYSYCHGRSTLNKNILSQAIYFNRNTEFDKLMLEELREYYETIITIESKFEDQILDDYQMLIQSMYLTKYIAEQQDKDLSKVDYSPIVKKLYKYHGEI